jgi:hypothetical protein
MSSLNPWSKALLEKLTGCQLVKKFPHFMEPESSLQHSQVPATYPVLSQINTLHATPLILEEPF